MDALIDAVITDHVRDAMNSSQEPIIRLDKPLTIPAGEYRTREIAELLTEAMVK